MTFSQLIGINGGILSVIGSGGKSGLLRILSEQLPGTVILTTTTHIFPFDHCPLITSDDPSIIRQALRQNRIVTAASIAGHGKLTAPAIPFAKLSSLARWVLVEADGSKRLPIKAHAPHEPVIPPGCDEIICVVGASGFGGKIAEVVHRPEIFCRISGASPEERLTPKMTGSVLAVENLASKVFLNQVESSSDWQNAQILAEVLKKAGITMAAGSLRNQTCRLMTKL